MNKHTFLYILILASLVPALVFSYSLEVETRSAINIEEHEVTLRGDLNALEDEATVYFQWGKTDSYGFKTSEMTMDAVGDFSNTIYGLEEDTLYHFRAVAEEDGHIDRGQDRTFRTDGDANHYPPVSDAGPDKTVYEDNTVRLDGSGYDPDGGDVSFYWNCSTGSVDDQYDNNPMYEPREVDEDKTFTCTLRVVDDEYEDDSDSMRVLVKDRDTHRDGLDIVKKVQNISRGDSSTWYNVRSGNPLHILKFKITVTANEDLEDVRVREDLPENVIYQGNLKVDGSSVSKDITDGINIGDMDDGETIEITFLAKIANKDDFDYGTTDLVNEVRVYTDDESETDTCIVRVRKSDVQGITDIPTGVFGFSLLIPLLGAALLIFVFRSKLVGLDQITSKRSMNISKYRADKKLAKMIKKHQ